jgi:hypothetical protein
MTDRVLLAQLALYGRFYEVPETLLFHRDHEMRLAVVHGTRHSLARANTPELSEKFIFPAWRTLEEYTSAIWSAPLSWQEKWRCLVRVSEWARIYKAELLEDVTMPKAGARKNGRPVHARRIREQV